jgi:hypothetical protein
VARLDEQGQQAVPDGARGAGDEDLHGGSFEFGDASLTRSLPRA